MLDDGVVEFYKLENKSAAGNLPDRQPVLFSTMAFDYQTMGFEKYEVAKQYGDRIDYVIRCWQDLQINSRSFIAKLEDGINYSIKMVQPYTDDQSGLRMMRIYLEKVADDE